MKTAITVVLSLSLAAGLLYGTATEQPPPIPAQEQPEVLTRGPVHEAFAEPVNLQIQAGLVVPNHPPANIVQSPPAERPIGDYYGDAYLSIVIYPRYEVERNHTWYDPIYVYDRWRHRNEPRWEATPARQKIVQPPTENKVPVTLPAERREQLTQPKETKVAFVPPREVHITKTERVKIPAPPLVGKHGADEKGPPPKPVEERQQVSDTKNKDKKIKVRIKMKINEPTAQSYDS